MKTEILLTIKELVALRYLADQSELGAVKVSHFRDVADCGWLKVAITPQLQYGSRPREDNLFKVSPLGHIYNYYTGDVLLSYEDFEAQTATV